MAFDFGLRQIGVAAGNGHGPGQALPVLTARDGVPDWADIQALVDEWRPDLLLVGDPLNMDGSDSELCALARKFARRLHGRLGLPVEMVDERLSSVEVKRDAAERGHRGNYRRQPLDSEAARLVLSTWFAENT